MLFWAVIDALLHFALTFPVYLFAFMPVFDASKGGTETLFRAAFFVVLLLVEICILLFVEAECRIRLVTRLYCFVFAKACIAVVCPDVSSGAVVVNVNFLCWQLCCGFAQQAGVVEVLYLVKVYAENLVVQHDVV